MKYFKIQKILFTASIFAFLINSPIFAQTDSEERIKALENRVAALEEYVKKLSPTMDEFSKVLVNNLDGQVKEATGRIAVLNPVNKMFTKIETNSGMFLISVKKMEKVDNGYRLVLEIGNPNAATYSGVKLRLHWGKKWDPTFVHPSYDEWRGSLKGAEYSYPGALESGQWTQISVDVVPAENTSQIERLECEMDVETVKLQEPKT